MEHLPSSILLKYLEENISLRENNYKHILWYRSKMSMTVKSNMKTALPKGATSPGRRKTYHLKPLQCKVIFVMMNILKPIKVRAGGTTNKTAGFWSEKAL